MTWVERLAGAALIVLALEDLFFTTLFPGNYRGVVQIPLRRVFWRAFRLVTRAFQRSRGRLLTYSGPVMIFLHVAAWLTFLTVGFALIAWPELGTTIRDTQGKTDTTFWMALYFSGYSITTLGTGDVVATTAPFRVMMVLEAFVGFSTITLALTYFLAVYSALVRRSTLALTLDARTEGTGDAVRLLRHAGAGGDFEAGRGDIAPIATALLDLMESHRYYPILRYFHFHDVRNSLPRMLFLGLDTATLARSALDGECYAAFVESSAVTELWYGLLKSIRELADTLLSEGASEHHGQYEEAWRRRYDRAIELLDAAGIQTAPVQQEGAQRYVTLRRQWEPALSAIASYLAYEWTAIAPHEAVEE
jgi:hypothetical protein